jgi:hypothetical protein
MKDHLPPGAIRPAFSNNTVAQGIRLIEWGSTWRTKTYYVSDCMSTDLSWNSCWSEIRARMWFGLSQKHTKKCTWIRWLWLKRCLLSAPFIMILNKPIMISAHFMHANSLAIVMQTIRTIHNPSVDFMIDEAVKYRNNTASWSWVRIVTDQF